MHLLLTEDCQLACRHCYLPEPRRRGRLALADYQKLLREARGLGTLFVTLSGGEPTLHPAFFEIAEEVRLQSLVLKVITNGYTLAGDPAERLARLWPAEVAVSLYGDHAETHDWMTQVSGSFVRTLKSIEQLVELGVPVTVKTPVMRPNGSDLPGIRALCARLGVRLHASPRLLAPHGKEELRSGLSCDEAQLREALAGDQDFGRSLERMCGAGCSLACVDGNGQVMPCPIFAVPVGSLLEASFTELWTSAPLFAQLRSLSFADLPECGRCESRWHCSRCVGQVYARSGSLLGKDPDACRLAKAKNGC